MNTTSPDELDRRFSDFFKAQLRTPWPNAPVPDAAARVASPRNAPAPGDHTARARFTLAASVALVLGATLAMSDGFQSGPRPAVSTPASGGSQMLPGSSANGNHHLPLKQIEEDKAKGGNKIDLGKIGDE